MPLQQVPFIVTLHFLTLNYFRLSLAIDWRDLDLQVFVIKRFVLHRLVRKW